MTRRARTIASTLDIEQLFEQDRVRTEQTFQSPKSPTTDAELGVSAREGAQEMAMIRVEPVEVRVRTGWLDGTPREITWGDERLPVTRLAAVREEAAAFPVVTGPRTLFEVETPRARLGLTYQHRSRRWTITALDAAA